MELRRRMKDVMALFLVAVMVISIVPASTLVVQAASDKQITLGNVTWGDNNTTFKFQDANVSSTEAQTILCVSVDNGGYFTAPTTYFTGAEISAVDINNKYVETITSSGQYTAITVVGKSKGSLLANDIAGFIRSLTFYRNGAEKDAEQKVSVAASPVSLGDNMTVMAIDGEIHYYKEISYLAADGKTALEKYSGDTWYDAYNGAKEQVFNGLRGYLTTITSAAEQYYVYGSLARKTSVNPQLWIGGARTLKSAFTFDAKTVAKGALTPGSTSGTGSSIGKGHLVNGKTTTDNSNYKYVTSWYWVCGPEAGTQFYESSETGGRNYNWTGTGYQGWNSDSGEPNNKYDSILGTDAYYDQEYALEYGFKTANWNDYSPYNVNREDYGIKGYLVEFSPYTSTTGESSIANTNAYTAAASTSKVVSLAEPQISARNFTITQENATKYATNDALNDSGNVSAIKNAAGVSASAKGEDKTAAVEVTSFTAVDDVSGVYDVTFQLTVGSSETSDEKTVTKTVKALVKEEMNSGTGTDGKAVSVGADNITVKLSKISTLSADDLKKLLLNEGAPVAVVGDDVIDSSNITVKKTSIPEKAEDRTSGIYTVTFTYDGVDVTVDVTVEDTVAPPEVTAHDILTTAKEIADNSSNLGSFLKEQANAKFINNSNQETDDVKLADESEVNAVAAMTTAGEQSVTFVDTQGNNKSKTVNVTVVDHYNSADASGVEIGANNFCISLEQANAVVTSKGETEQIEDMLKELANATAMKSGYNVATGDISVDASEIKAAKGVYPVVFTYKDVSVTSYVTVKDNGTTGVSVDSDTNLTANNFAIAAKSDAIDEATFIQLANVTANENDGTPVTVKVNEKDLQNLNNAIAEGKGVAEVEVYADDKTKTKVYVTITDNTSVAQSSTPNGITGATVTIAANDFVLGTGDKDKLTAEAVKKLSNAQAYITATKEELSIDAVDVSSVKIDTPGTYPVVLKISSTNDIPATTATIYVTVSGDYETVGDVDKAAEANKTSSTVNQDSAVKTSEKTPAGSTNSEGNGDTGTLGTGAGTGTTTVDETGLIPIKDIQDALGVSAETAAKIQEMAKQYNVSLDTLKITDESIAALKNDNDMKGTSFGRLKARAIKCKNKQFKLEWTKTSGADGYMIYGNRCNSNGKKYKYKYVKTVSKKTTSMKIKKLEKGTYYKYLVRAYKLIDGKKVTIATSVTVHATTTGGKWGIAKAVKLKKIGSKKVSSTKSAKYTLKVGKKAKISATEVKQTSKTIRHHRDICYESSDTSVATVNKKGQITAKGKGKCQIWVYAQNGVYSTINLTVK